MKILHISDLHIGKRLHECSMIEDQKYILNKILNVIKDEKVEAVLIAGDVYDKGIPSEEAVHIFDDFLSELVKLNVKAFVIAGNHDSQERLSFGSRIMTQAGIYLSQAYNGSIAPITIQDDYGDINIYMLPYIQPNTVRRFFEGKELSTYTDAVKAVVDAMNVDKSKRNVLIAHQFITGASTTDSEQKSVGGTDNVDISALEGFDYVALGHLHRPQSCGGIDTIRYSGTPLKYSFSESKDTKSVTILDVNQKGDLKISTIELKPLRDLVELKGKYAELMNKDFYEGKSFVNDYVRVTLTDEDDILEAMNRMRTVYKNILTLDYDNTRTRTSQEIQAVSEIAKKTPNELFAEFFNKQNNQDMSEDQESLISALIKEIWEVK